MEPIKLGGLKPLARNFFSGDVEEVAKSLIGIFLFTADQGGNYTGGMIVETEAYDERDPAAHCHEDANPRRRNHSASMRLKGGYAYIHPERNMWCLNFTSGVESVGSAVLIRALRPICGIATMRQRRIEGALAGGEEAKTLKGNNYLKHLCSGPARLCEALGIDNALDGKSLGRAPFDLRARDFEPKIMLGPRVNVPKAKDLLRRYALKGSEFISKRDQKYPLSEIGG